MKTILVTGVAGFIGSSLADKLIERNDTVVGIDDFNEYYNPQIKRGNLKKTLQSNRFSLIELDIRDEGGVRRIFNDVRPDVVVHLAARAGVRPSLKDPNLYHQVNVVGSQHILDACRDFRPSHLVFASSSSVYGGCVDIPFTEAMSADRPVSPYAATKRMNELMAHVYSHVYGMKVTMLRFFTVYGPRQRPDMAIHKFTKLIEASNLVPMYGDGTTARDYTYIDDILDGVVKAIDRPFQFEIFNLGENRTTTLRELVKIISMQLGKPANIEQYPLQPGDVETTYADISKAKAMLDYAPSIKIEEGLRRFVVWYRQQRAASADFIT